MSQPHCQRRMLSHDDSEYRRCRRFADFEYVVDPEGGLSPKPIAYLCKRHKKLTTPEGYICRPVQWQ